MQTFKKVLIKTCKEETLNLLCVFVFLYFYSKPNNYVFCLLLDKKDIIFLMIAFA